MLSNLLGFQTVDPSGRRARLTDLDADLGAGDYPPVTRLFYHRPGEGQVALPWAAVGAIDWPRRRLTVPDLTAGRPAPPDALRTAVLLKRDVLDALVIDLANRQATRANDLWLVAGSDGTLTLRGADVSPWAVFRRLVPRILGQGTDRRLLDWRHVEFLRGNPRAAAEGHDYHRRIVGLPAREIALLLDALPYLHAAELLTLIPDSVAADTLEAMTPARQTQVFEELDEARALRLLALMAPDLAADLIGRLDLALARRYLERLPAWPRGRLLELLRYPEDTAGGIMTNDVVLTAESLTVARSRAELRERLREPDFVYYVYVVDAPQTRRLRGVVTLRDLLVAEDDRPLREVMATGVAAVDPLEPAVEAARRVADHELAALPVVARDGRLLGAITADAAVDQLAPPTWRGQAPRVFA